MPLAMRPLRDQMAHCRRTTVQPSALTRSPPTFKRRQAACESLAGRLHSELDNVVSRDVTLKRRVKPSSKEVSSCSKTPYQAVRQHARNRNALKQTGTGSSRGPRPRGLGAQMFNSNALVRVEHFYPVPVYFGVIRELIQHSLGGCGGLKHENRVYVSRGMLRPHLPFGYSSPTREECSPPKMRDMLFILFD